MDWNLKYLEISEKLGLDRKKDEDAAEILRDLSSGALADLNEVKERIENRNVVVFGAGPSLKEDLKKVKDLNLIKDFVLIASDGAVKALIEESIYPDFLVTDLDGDMDSILKANKNCITVVHAHADNIPALKKYVPIMKNLIPTTQSEPKKEGIFNFGGFTDGDRAVFFAIHFKAASIILTGMDFGEVVGEYSKKSPLSGKRLEFKIKKLKIGKELIEEAAKENPNIYDLTSHGNLKIKKLNLISIL